MMRIRRTLQLAMAIFVLAGAVLIYSPKGVQAECNVYHTVQAGQNLFRISLRYGVSLSALAAANGIGNVNLIYVGQRLYIPCGTTTTTTTGSTSGLYILVSVTPGPTLSSQFQSFATPPPVGTGTGQDCVGFRGTSPDAFSNGTDTFYWDAPSNVQIARYQVRILNAQGANVGSFETLAPNTHLVGDTSNATLGEGSDFYWYVVAVTADNRICQTATRYAQREWPKPGPTVTLTPTP